MCIYVSMYLYMYKFMYLFVFIYVYTCIYVCTYVCIYPYIKNSSGPPLTLCTTGIREPISALVVRSHSTPTSAGGRRGPESPETLPTTCTTSQLNFNRAKMQYIQFKFRSFSLISLPNFAPKHAPTGQARKTVQNEH